MKRILLALIVLLPFSICRAEEAPVAAATPAAHKRPAHRTKKMIKRAAQKPAATTAPAAAQASAPDVSASPRPKSMSRNLEEWLAKMKKRVAASRAKQNKVVAVASVRGDDKSDPTPLYWKGKESEKVVDKADLDEFNSAMELAESGDKQGAAGKLEQFVSARPQSPLVDDAKQTIVMLKSDAPAAPTQQ
jgi:TolA-binding protein